MNEYHFGLGVGHLPEEANKIARKHGAWLVNYTEPNGQKQHWFACQNFGEPFNQATADAVISELMRSIFLPEEDSQ